MRPSSHKKISLAAAVIIVSSIVALTAVAGPLGNVIVLVNNDLGMHCMNKDHSQLSVLPPYNDLQAQVIQRGNATTLPQIVTSGMMLEYTFPGNTYSAGKTNFWDYAFHLFGVDLPADVGLTGKTLYGLFDIDGDIFRANGIPVTPFMDETPTVEQPFQVAQVILRTSGGIELARAYPVVPVSTEMNCVSSGCHTSEMDILTRHADPAEGGFDVANKPILCAQCHGSTPLTGPNPGTAGWFSLRIHEKHAFIDQQIPGMAGCYKCHPGPNTRCLRGTMATNHGLICQDCHGTMTAVKSTIDGGRIPWVQEPACRTCHTAAFGEPVGQLYRNSRGHGGVLCSNCHNSPHADFPSREARDNRVMLDLQGGAGILTKCDVCHGVVPAGSGPHGVTPTAVHDEVFAAPDRLRVFPSPTRQGSGCTIMASSSRVDDGKLLVFDVLGRTVRMLRARADGQGSAVVEWDGNDASGSPVASGTYFLRWEDGQKQAGGKIVFVR
ncbi:MAG: hypothetical protein H6Q86_4257 [candidate division NC10 bacterium]|nr:hypothetical protein [candidate division NC10 bacterium]